MTARNYPTLTHLNTWAWCVAKISITTAADAALRPFTVGTFSAKKFLQDNVFANRLHAHIHLAP
jgi:hypothetical protein